MNKKSYKMKQCKLIRPLSKVGHQIYVSWIPAKFAVKGHVVDIKNQGTWTVDEVWSEEDIETVVAMSHAHTQHRIATDI